MTNLINLCHAILIREKDYMAICHYSCIKFNQLHHYLPPGFAK